MESIATLQAKMTEAGKIIRDTAEALEKLKERGENKAIKNDLIKRRAAAKNYPYVGHQLTHCQNKELYFMLMMAILQQENNQENGWSFLYRIAWGVGYDKDVYDLMPNVLTMDDNSLKQILEMIDREKLTNAFLLDSILLDVICQSQNERIWRFLTDLYEILDTSPEKLQIVIDIAKCVAGRDKKGYDQARRKAGQLHGMSISDSMCYMVDMDRQNDNDSHTNTVKSSLEQIETCQEEEVTILNGRFKNIFIDLDSYKPTKFIFVGCTFDTIVGIRSTASKRVEYRNCSFMGNVKQYIWGKGTRKVDEGRGATYNGYTKERKADAFITLENGRMEGCYVSDISDGVPVIAAKNADITDTTFNNCSIETDIKGGAMLMYFEKNTELKKSKFINCIAKYKDSNRLDENFMSGCVLPPFSPNSKVGSGYGLIVFNNVGLNENVMVQSCEFYSCDVKESFKPDMAYLLEMANSRRSNSFWVKDCYFDNCMKTPLKEEKLNKSEVSPTIMSYRIKSESNIFENCAKEK